MIIQLKIKHYKYYSFIDVEILSDFGCNCKEKWYKKYNLAIF